MAQYMIRRLIVAVPTFFAITVIVFALFALSPGDPVINIIGFDTFALMSPDQIELVRQQYGFNDSWYSRYFNWLGDALRGDLGYPYKGGKTVSELLVERIPPTLLLMGTSLVLALVVGIPMGIIMALRQYSKLDYGLTIVAFANLSIPSFFMALAFIYVFALRLDILPTYGMQTIGAPFSIWDRFKHLIMPAVILGLFNAGVWARYARSSVLEIKRLDFVTVARAKGLKERTVVSRHIFRNALIPLITVIGLSIPQLLGGAIIIETIFQWPGMGMLGWRATTTRDYPTLMGITLLSATIILLSNLITDIGYAIADPRIRYD
jgi:peptide/nickel transport system permease protein